MNRPFFSLTRRGFGKAALGALGAAALPRAAFATMPADTPLHGLSVYGELKYGPDFPAFDYASPDAPAGGRFAFSVPNWAFNQSPLTFDTLNTFVLKGNAPPRLEMLYDSLVVSALDEPDAVYCALAQSVSIAADRNSYLFALRPQARFSTGAPVTAEDVAFTYATFKEKGHPVLQIALQELTRATAEPDGRVRLVFSGRQTHQDALGAMGMPILPKAFFEGRAFEDTGMTEIPGSGPYRIGRQAPGRFIEYEKRDDYWARDLGFARGLDHFKTLRIDFYRDRQAGFEAFKKGDTLFRQEFTAKTWATEYGFPAVAAGKVVKREFAGDLRPTFQCWALNQRRPRFADIRVRQAVNLCFDFQWTNANLFFGLYKHSDSPFETSEFKAEGAPSPAELAILEPLRGQIPDAAFGPAWTQGVSDGSGRDRRRLQEASKLLAAAGWERRGNQLVNQAGEVFTLEYLIDDPGFERVYGSFVQTLRLLGVDARFRLVDAAQYQDRQDRFDFDLIGQAIGLGATPSQDSLVGLFGSSTRDRQGSNNLVGMADPAVDRLIETVNRAPDRAGLTIAMKALDRVLRARLDWIPNIHSGVHRAAYWDRFGFKEPKPDFGWPVESLWWFDPAKAQTAG
ncbi:extracellular solute-binding protein [Aurantimonas sp. Leaf443]|uniref:extracellular solute-binding protein n=1 Tax=Aurantimonas sp. Leaf443 TaxID=1736378 RepID=UPI0007011206|nr:extracellular solute-binding protein [Aurantimonas sp. Leaf443]KQT85636.1 hypothetical protein ASG48_08870 [Aurantimonas sp. Leaf443]